MSHPIKRVAVLGAGVMGSGIAAHLASAGVRSLMLDIVPREPNEEERRRGWTVADKAVRNRFAAAGKENALKSKPALFLTPKDGELIEVGNLEDDLGRVAECDWIVEVVKEDLGIKRDLFARLDAIRRPGTIVTSNTSGLSIAALIAGRSEDFRRHFLVTHFFNPVRYMKLLEIVAGPDTDPAIVERMAAFGREQLGKGIVYGKDTPNFVANRIGVFAMMTALRVMDELGLTVPEIDAIAGPAMGKPKSAIFRTADMVGLDTFLHVTRNCYDALPKDENRDLFVPPAWLEEMVKRGWLGLKTKGGFYKKDKAKGENLYLDLKALEYRPVVKPTFDSVGATKGAEDAGERMRRLLAGSDVAATFAWKVTAATLAYAARRLGEIADDVVNVDNAMKWGFNWDLGPFETWDALGVREVAARMEKDGVVVPERVKALLAAGQTSFYGGTPGRRTYFDYAKSAMVEVPAAPGRITIARLREENRLIKENGSASLYDMGDDVLLLEFHSKMNTVDGDIIALMHEAIGLAETKYAGLVVGNEAADAFCAGANLFQVLMGVNLGQWKAVEKMVADFQQANLRLRYSDAPTVAAPFGLTLGGGAEVCLGADAIRGHCELYMGLVELGVGVIPAGGGCTNLLGRWVGRLPDDPAVDPLPMLRKVFEAIGMAKVSFSAEEARDLGYLRESDGVTLGRDRLLADAKQTVLGLARAGYRRPRPRYFRLPGESGAAAFEWFLYNLKIAGNISEHDEKIGKKLARILTGGTTSTQTPVSEAHILELEREVFLSLCGERKTQERMQYMLMNGKPLRN